jgi:hypothetical protein
MKHISSQFDYMETDWLWILNSIFYFSKSLFIFGRDDQTWVVTYYVENESILSHVFRVYCHPSWYLVIQCVEHWCICYAKSLMNTKQYMFYVNGINLYLLLPILNCCGRFLLSVFFWKRDIVTYLLYIFFSWPIVYWVLDKDITVKKSSTLV